ncbi:MAG: META domain-containing protein [Formosimonas sp.]
MLKKLALLACSASMVACAAGGTGNSVAPTAQLTGHEWQVTRLAGAPVVAQPTIAFDGGKMMVSGNASCNHYFGSYALNGSKITFSGMGMTRMACLDEAVSKQEYAFSQALDQVRSYALDAQGVLHLQNAKGEDVLLAR